MVYKKNNTVSMIVFAIICAPLSGVVAWFSTHNKISVILGIVTTLIIVPIGYTLLTQGNTNKAKARRSQLSMTEKIICEGPANLIQPQLIVGWLFVTENFIELFPLNKKAVAQQIKIPITEISDVSVNSNKLLISNKSGEVFTFTVEKSSAWQNTISEIIKIK